MMVKISVLTPTIRIAGLPIVEKALKRQSFKQFEWIVGSKIYPKEVSCQWIKDDFRGGFWTLNRCYNMMIRAASGELLVSWQDYTYADPDTLWKFWNHYQHNKQSLVSAVGNKYEDERWADMVWKDPRERDDMGSFYEVYPYDIEANLCSAPKEAMYDVGGFDEEMDFIGFGFDARGVFERLDLIGEYKFYLDQTIKSYSLPHDRPEGWDDHNMLDRWLNYKQEQLDKKRYPVLNYLQRQNNEKLIVRQK